ncbi:MAG: DUF309 domain-containing protein [Alicyclobacillus sp.]|nr:DUF309 domain-containing protein [Alicyclobacillus sp.]
MDPRLLSYVYCFNVTGDYFACHEYGELLWLESGRPLVLKGLIQAAVCLYHLYNGNLRGGWRMWQRARTYLATAGPVYEGLDLEQLRLDLDAVWARVPPALREGSVPPAEVCRWQLPRVTLRVIDTAVQERLATWQLPPLPEAPDRHDA